MVLVSPLGGHTCLNVNHLNNNRQNQFVYERGLKCFTMSPNIRTGVVPRLKNDSDRMVGVSLVKPVFLTAAGRSSNPGGGLGLAMIVRSPTNSSEAKGSGILRDDILIAFSSLLGSYSAIRNNCCPKIC